jgi:hypothetical protein
MGTCFAMTAYTGSAAGGSSVLNFDCGTDWSAFTIFQELATTTTSSRSSSTYSFSKKRSTHFYANTQPGITTSTSTSSASSNLTPTSSPTPTPSQTATPAHSSSKDWIAGAVIGPIAVAVALAFLGY